MLFQIGVQLAGLVLSVGPLLVLICRMLKDGWKNTFQARQRRMPAVLEDSKYGRHGFVEGSAGVQLHYVEKGDRKKPLMLFLHGFPEFWFSWRFQLAHFSSDYWCVAIDMRGYNDSSKPQGIQQYSLDALVADVKAAIEGLGRSQCNVLVAHDWGGAVGYAFCDQWPQMVGHYVTLNIPHPSSLRDQQSKSWKQKLMSWYMLFFQCPVLPEIFFRSSDLTMLDGIVAQMKNDDPEEIKEAYKYAFRDPASVTAAINYYRCALQYPADRYFKDPIKVPVLSIFGTADKYLSVASAEGTQHYVKTLKQEFLEGIGHWVQMENPDKVNRIMRDYLLE